MRKIKQIQHGFRRTKVYRLWADIVKRCEYPKGHNYKYYGGRGIKICKSWRNNAGKFCRWALRNGYKKGLEIDRINNDGNYSPQNCQFITHKNNSAVNKRRLRYDNKTGESGILKTKFGTYEVYVTINGKQKFYGTYKTFEEAKNVKYDKLNIYSTPELLKGAGG